jgi:hypothetical protein
MRRDFAALRVSGGLLRKFADSQSDSQGRDFDGRNLHGPRDQNDDLFPVLASMFHGKNVSQAHLKASAERGRDRGEGGDGRAAAPVEGAGRTDWPLMLTVNPMV